MPNVDHRIKFAEGSGVEICPNPVLDVEAVFDCVGIPAFVDEFLRHAKQYTRLCMIAVHRTDIPIRFHEVMSTQCALMGSRGYEPADIKEVIQNLAEGRIRPQCLVFHTFSLKNTVNTFESASDPTRAVNVCFWRWNNCLYSWRAFIAGATFCFIASYTLFSIILVIPGFLVWIASYFLYRVISTRKSVEVMPIINRKYDEI